MLVTMKTAMARMRAIQMNGADMAERMNRMMPKSYTSPQIGNRIISGSQITMVIITPIIRAAKPEIPDATGTAPAIKTKNITINQYSMNM